MTNSPVDLPAHDVIIRETWLTQKPAPEAAMVAMGSTAFVALISTLIAFNWMGLGNQLTASAGEVFGKGEYWRAWTTVFAHGDAAHLISNSFLFFILGFFLNGYFGLGVFPLAAFVFGGLINLAVLPTYDPNLTLIGASGVVYWMGGVWLVLYYFLSRQKNQWQRWLRTLGVAILIFMPAQTFDPQVSYRTHLIGFIFGVGFGILYYLANRGKLLAAELRETIFDEIENANDLPLQDETSVEM